MPEGDFQSFVVYLDETKIDEISQLLDISGDFIQNFDAASRRLNLGSTGVINSAQTEFDTGTGFFLGNDEGVAKFSIGDSDGDKVTWDGSSLNITGGFTVSSISTSESGRRVELSDTLDSLIVYDGDGNPTTALKAVLAFPASTTISDAYNTYGVGTYMVDRDTAYIVWTRYIDSTHSELNFSKTTDGGSTYATLTKIDNGLTADPTTATARKCVYASDANTVFIVYKDQDGDDLHLAKTTDGGSNWTLSTIDDDVAANTGNAEGIVGTSSNNLFVVWFSENTSGDNQTVDFTKSTDGGSTWSTKVQIHTEGASGTVNASVDMSIIDDDNIWIALNTGNNTNRRIRWFSTSDGGANWTARGAPTGNLGQASMCITAVSATEIYGVFHPSVGTGGSTLDVYKSTGGDLAHKEDLTGMTGNAAATFMLNTNTVFIAGRDGNGDFWAGHSTDGGTSFGEMEIETNTTDDFLAVAMHGISEKEMIVAWVNGANQDVEVTMSQGADVIHLGNVSKPSIPPTSGTYLYSKSGEQYTMDSSGNETLNS
jgi:hypothetical protein